MNATDRAPLVRGWTPRAATRALGAFAWSGVWIPYALIGLVQIAAGAVYLANRSSGVAAGFDSFPLDDGWIHMVYARSFAQSLQFFYNPGEPESGMTSPLWAV
ncbi:MAG: hypothetical protein FJ313_02915, partial [Gemmatimonadetes bacterium]|nr:hypothetical protein [Gemmatimonadota bacterium]